MTRPTIMKCVSKLFLAVLLCGIATQANAGARCIRCWFEPCRIGDAVKANDGSI